MSLSDPRLVIGRLVKYSALIGQITERPPGLSRETISPNTAQHPMWQLSGGGPGPSGTFS